MFSFLWLLLQSLAFIGAIGTNGSFPQPLSPEEEQKWVKKLIEGDEEAREKLIVHNLRLCAHIAKKYQNIPSFFIIATYSSKSPFGSLMHEWK